MCKAWQGSRLWEELKETKVVRAREECGVERVTENKGKSHIGNWKEVAVPCSAMSEKRELKKA